MSYDTLSPADRAAYLNWLAGDRVIDETAEAYVELFLYGLERRLLADPAISAAAMEDRSGIVDELRRLRGDVGDDGDGHSTYEIDRLLEFSDAQDVLSGRVQPRPPVERQGWDTPQELRLQLGRMASSGLPLSVDWALSWVRTSIEAYLRTPAQRCPEEFEELFAIRYLERFTDGLSLPTRAPEITLDYYPLSPALDQIDESTGVPDVASAPQVVDPLRELARDCCTELDAYSRWLGRNPEDRGSLAAIALLPASLLGMSGHPALAGLRRFLSDVAASEPPWAVEATALLKHWPGADTKSTKQDAVALAQLLEKLGFGIEPDVRFGGASLAVGTLAVVFRATKGDPRAPSPAYAVAATLLQLVAAVAVADGTISEEEERHLETHVEGVAGLFAGERERLRAHTERLIRSKPAFGGLRKKLDALEDGQRQAIGDSLIAVAAADGQVTPDEMKILSKVFDLLGMGSDALFTAVHEASARPSATAPVTVRPAGREAPRHMLPPESQVGLDRDSVDAKIEETAVVSSLLASIFEDDRDDVAGVAVDLAEEERNAGLDGRHAAFARDLTARDSWPRIDVEALAAQHGLLVDGALESVNDAAFEICDSPVAEGDDPIEIDLDVAKEMLG